jgi:DNA-binding response OmpR family regulator
MASILLIEDDELLREYLSEGLGDAGHRVREAESGDKGLAMFRADPADLLITDLVMDDGEGVGTIMALRDACPQTPVIAISGNPLYLDSACKLGADRGLLKPFTMTQMLDTVAGLLRPASTRSA